MGQQTRDVPSDFAADPRTEEQRQRCRELAQHQLRHTEPYEIKVAEFDIVVHPGVFPPEIGLTTTLLVSAISQVGEVLRQFSKERMVGIDVGTGTGILALALSEHCDIVYATDILEAAVENAKQNVETHAEVKPSSAKIKVNRGNLLDPIPELDEKAFILAVFNYPYYPSPLAVFNPDGRERAGLPIVRDFLMEAKEVVRDRGVIVMPYSSISAEHNPVKVAINLDLQTAKLVERASNGHVDAVYAFTANNELHTALKALQKPRQSPGPSGKDAEARGD